ncbi:MAG: hypothetical protein ABI623_04170 [bacterium]
MVTSKRRFSGVLFTLFYLSICTVIAYGEDVTLTIELDKAVFMRYEELTLYYTVKNVSGKALSIRTPLHSTMGLYFEIINSYDVRLKHTGLSGGKGMTRLRPNESFVHAYSIRDFYGDPDSTRFARSVPAGTYRVVAFLQTNDRVKVTSNRIMFSVIEPSGEELAAARLLNDAKDKLIGSNKQEQIQKLTSLCKKYPNSRYRPEALFLIAENSLPNEDFSAKSAEFQKIIHEYPNSVYARASASKIARELKDVAKENFLSDLKSKYPQTRVGKMAAEFLKAK